MYLPSRSQQETEVDESAWFFLPLCALATPEAMDVRRLEQIAIKHRIASSTSC